MEPAKLVEPEGFQPSTSRVRGERSSAELRPQFSRCRKPSGTVANTSLYGYSATWLSRLQDGLNTKAGLYLQYGLDWLALPVNEVSWTSYLTSLSHITFAISFPCHETTPSLRRLPLPHSKRASVTGEIRGSALVRCFQRRLNWVGALPEIGAGER